MKTFFHDLFEDLISIENLLLAWQEFLKGKKNKRDVQEFQLNLMDNILALHHDLKQGLYRHGPYQRFTINDPKPRIIHKAAVRDRLLHHAVYRVLYPFFEKTFIADSFSCRDEKGVHKAMARFRRFAYIVSKNNTKTCWILKCDIRKFFASIDQDILLSILDGRIADKYIMVLLKEIIGSFPAGLPLGNLTSQLFCNIYMNEFDQFVKHKLKAIHYVRYADDFVILSPDKQKLVSLLPLLQSFLGARLSLTLHPDKVFVKTLASGVDFLGWVHFLHHKVLRTATKRRIFTVLAKNTNSETLNSYAGLLRHGNTHFLREKMLNLLAFKSTIDQYDERKR